MAHVPRARTDREAIVHFRGSAGKTLEETVAAKPTADFDAV